MLQIEMTNLAKMGTGFPNKCHRGLRSMAQALLLKLGMKPPVFPSVLCPPFSRIGQMLAPLYFLPNFGVCLDNF